MKMRATKDQTKHITYIITYYYIITYVALNESDIDI